MDKFDRIFQLHAILSRRKAAISAADLMLRMECSRATLHRTLALLKDTLHAPIEFDETAAGYRYAASSAYELPGLWFSAAELQSLVFLQRLAEDAGGGILQEQLRALSKRLSELTRHKRLNLAEAAARLRFPALAARPAGAAFESVLSATLQRRQIDFDYHARGTDERTHRSISPQRIVHYREAWYLDGWDETKAGLRSFSLDRISGAQIAARAARDIPEPELDAHFAGSFGIFGGRPDKQAVLRFSAERARWVADEQWHPEKRAHFLEDGRYELTIPYADARELVMEILRHGPHVEVLAPEALRAEVLSQLETTLGLYRS